MMKLIKPWVSDLNIDVADYSSWVEKAPKNISLTYWCLMSGKIDESQYLDWARNHYELVSLNTSYFTASPQTDFWKKIKSVANWSKDLLPLSEWDGTVFIGCVEPLQDTKWSFPVQYVLASAIDLENYWNQLNNNLHNNEVSFVGIPPTPDKQSVVGDAPEGLNFSHSATTENKEEFSGVTRLAEAPEGLSGATQLTEAPEGLSGVTQLTEAPEGFVMPDLPHSILESQTVKDDHLKEKGATVINFAPKPEPVISTPPPSPAMIDFLNTIKKDFSYGMILSVENGNVHVEAADSFFKPEGDAYKKWSLSSPSAFRIAYRTKMPYLGHIVETQINSDFFKSWGLSKLPKHVLLQPVIVNGEVKNLILAIGQEEQKNHHNLQTGERLAKEFLSISSVA